MEKINTPSQEPLSQKAQSLLSYYRELIAVPQTINIGHISRLQPRFPGDESPGSLREYKVQYPPTLNKAYALLCEQHDTHLMTLIENHKEHPTDYQFAPHSIAFQVDGPAYPDEFLKIAAQTDPSTLLELLKTRIFEVENNIAGYDLNGRLWPDGTTATTWRNALDQVRQRTGRKIAVLASTDAKYEALLKNELGIVTGTPPLEEEVKTITGFDAVWGPTQLIKHFVDSQGRDSAYVFFGRTSRSTAWLDNPLIHVDEPFLAEEHLRRYVRSFAITHNFDNPYLGLSNSQVVTDTKAALCSLGVVYPFSHLGDIYSPEFLEFISRRNFDMNGIYFSDTITSEKKAKLGKKLESALFNGPITSLLSRQFRFYLESMGIDPLRIANNQNKLRAKPLKRHYGAWGHVSGNINSSTFIKLLPETQKRGPYVLQPELQNYKVIDPNSGIEYLVIDRVFFVRDGNSHLKRMESIRAFMPAQSPEGQKNNVHDGRHTLDAAILP